jgi:pSer/pThr/pTyr-binding forkhead associated (FHA) protein
MIRRVSGDEFILEIIEGNSSGRQIPISGALELGRDPSLAVTLDDDQVSRRHGRVSSAEGGVLIEDLGSLNGTYVNDQLVQGPQKLTAGDRVRVGLTVLEVRTPEQVTVQRSAVDPAPEITVLGRDVLEVVPEEKLAPVRPDAPNIPGFLAEESEPGFINADPERSGSQHGVPGAGRGPEAVARLFDVRVKRQTNVATFAFLAISALAVLIYFGVR